MTPLESSRLWTLPGAVICYLVLICLYFYPYFNEISTHVIGGLQDSFQDYWNTWYAHNALKTNPSKFFFTELLYYPQGASLLHHSFAYSNVLLIHIVMELLSLPATTPVLLSLHNIALLAGYLVAALGAYLLCRHLTGNKLASFIAGFIFAFSPFHYVHFISHMHVATIQYIPFFVLFFLKSVENFKPTNLLLAWIFCLLGAMSSWYFLVYNFFFLGFYVLWYGFRERKLIPAKALLPAIVIGTLTLLSLSPVIFSMVKESAASASIYNTGHDLWIADLSGYFLFNGFHLLNWILEPLNISTRGNYIEKTVYLGIVNIVIL